MHRLRRGQVLGQRAPTCDVRGGSYSTPARTHARRATRVHTPALPRLDARLRQRHVLGGGGQQVWQLRRWNVVRRRGSGVSDCDAGTYSGVRAQMFDVARPGTRTKRCLGTTRRWHLSAVGQACVPTAVPGPSQPLGPRRAPTATQASTRRGAASATRVRAARTRTPTPTHARRAARSTYASEEPYMHRLQRRKVQLQRDLDASHAASEHSPKPVTAARVPACPNSTASSASQSTSARPAQAGPSQEPAPAPAAAAPGQSLSGGLYTCGAVPCRHVWRPRRQRVSSAWAASSPRATDRARCKPCGAGLYSSDGAAMLDLRRGKYGSRGRTCTACSVGHYQETTAAPRHASRAASALTRRRGQALSARRVERHIRLEHGRVSACYSGLSREVATPCTNATASGRARVRRHAPTRRGHLLRAQEGDMHRLRPGTFLAYRLVELREPARASFRMGPVPPRAPSGPAAPRPAHGRRVHRLQHRHLHNATGSSSCVSCGAGKFQDAFGAASAPTAVRPRPARHRPALVRFVRRGRVHA